MRHTGLVELLEDRTEVDLSFAERSMGARLVIVERAVGVDQLNVVDLTAKLAGQLDDASLQGLFFTGQPRTKDGHQIRMASI